MGKGQGKVGKCDRVLVMRQSTPADKRSNAGDMGAQIVAIILNLIIMNTDSQLRLFYSIKYNRKSLILLMLQLNQISN